jgi:hypothetical protein
MWNARLERDRAPFAVLDLQDYVARNHVLERTAAFMNWTRTLQASVRRPRTVGYSVLVKIPSSASSS